MSQRVLQGKSAFQGIAVGRIKELKAEEISIPKETVADVEAERERFEQAREEAGRQLDSLYQKALADVGEENASIFEVHRMMLEDEDYLETIREKILTEKVNSEYAVAAARDKFSEMFSSMEDAYMKERAADVRDISERIIRILREKKNGEMYTGQSENAELCSDETPYILVAEDLAPSDTLQLDRNLVLAFVTRKGSVNSHTAILARTMNIPAIVMVKEAQGIDGRMGIVDGAEGKLIVEPDEKTVKEYQREQKKQIENRKKLEALKGKPALTREGKRIKLYANIGGMQDAESALENDADGIGLFRSEFLYLKSRNYPDEEQQFQAYKAVAGKMGDRQVIIRTLDIGADKQIDYFHLDREENPALGYRAIRICLDRPDIFRTQLRAIYRASAYGRIAIMVPMITSLWEVKEVKVLLREVREELQRKQVPIGETEFGIMIETPAAVMVSEELAKEVDFFSIGTNDLTQYVLAIDRQNQKLERFYDAHHPAVLRMIKMVIDNAHKAGIWAGICGELGADLSMTERFLEMGVDELSVSPGMILAVKNRILEG